jgi:hypothetical protein
VKVDNAVLLVEAYLHLNGYFTVTEYPVIRGTRNGGYAVSTDLDILALRFPGAGRLVPGRRGDSLMDTDPALGIVEGAPDMLVGEVKEGRTELNRNTRSPEVLAAALIRFGCCAEAQVNDVIERLLRHGESRTAQGHRVRLVAFGVSGDEHSGQYHVVKLEQVLRYLTDHLRHHWALLRHAQIKQPALAQLALMEKISRHQTPNQNGSRKGHSR